MKIDYTDIMKMYSPEYVNSVAQANKKAGVESAAQEKTACDDVDISKGVKIC